MSGCSSEVYQQPLSESRVGIAAWRALLPRLDARSRQNAVLFGMLMAIQIAGAIFTPMSFGDTDSIWGLAAMAAIGSCLAPPALLALWAVFGPGPIIVRLPLTIWLAAVYYVVFLFAAAQENGAADAPASLFVGFVILAFLYLQAPLWLLRAVRRWRFVAAAAANRAVAADGDKRKRANQFTIRALLGWTLAAAVPLAAFRALVPESSFDADDLSEALPEIAFAGSLVALAGLSIVPLAWIFLAAGRRPVLRLVLSLILIAGLCGGSWLFIELSGGPGFAEIIPILVGTMANGLVSLAVVGACGYRLVREPRRGRGECPAPVETTERKPLSRVRFAIALAPLAALAVAVVCAMPYQLRQWRQAAVIAEWSRSGVNVSFDDSGKLTDVNGIDPLASDALLKRIAELSELEHLDVTGANIGDRQLALLAPLTNLRRLLLEGCEITDTGLQQLAPFQKLELLDLANTRVTDAGLANLKALPRLSGVHLQMTDVTDECLATLAGLPALGGFNVSLTAITRVAAEQFGAAHPGLSIEYGASDALLAQSLVIQRVTHSSGGYAMTVQPKRVKRLRAHGKYQLPGGALVTVTDAGLTTLAEHTELEELDLHDTGITDRGLLKLKKLTALKRLDVRGTQVTEQGVAALAQSLPECEIVR